MKRMSKRKLIEYSGLIVLVCVFIILLQYCLTCKVMVHQAFYEAKNAEFALRLLGTEYYAADRPVYDPTAPGGLAAGVAEEVAELSGAEGTVELSSWDAARLAPRSFTYTKGRLAVLYEYGEDGENHWGLYYRFRETKIPGRTSGKMISAAE